jgi:hypothetical protein
MTIKEQIYYFFDNKIRQKPAYSNYVPQDWNIFAKKSSLKRKTGNELQTGEMMDSCSKFVKSLIGSGEANNQAGEDTIKKRILSIAHHNQYSFNATDSRVKNQLLGMHQKHIKFSDMKLNTNNRGEVAINQMPELTILQE